MDHGRTTQLKSERTAAQRDVRFPHGSPPPRFSARFLETGFFKSFKSASQPRCKVTVVSAPTGYGKTMLLSAMRRHYEARGYGCLWCALDDRDGSVERVLAQLETTLILDAPALDVVEAVHEGRALVDQRIAAVVDALHARLHGDCAVVVFIDNLDACRDGALKYLLDTLVFHTPNEVHFVFSSTATLPFSQARAKIEGLVCNVGYAELSFTKNDIRELFGPALCARLSDDALDVIGQQTEGWPAAVRLMQIILSDAADPQAALEQFSGADEDLADLLNREVLRSFGDEARRFLLELSLLRHFSAESASAATGEERAGEYIQQLIDRNLFVIPLDRNRGEYRLHGLFREFLLDESARQIAPRRRMEILSCAAAWYERGQLWRDAVDYALESGSVPLAAGMLERVAALFVRDRGDLQQYIAWVERLNETGSDGGWETGFWYVWALVFYRRYEFARIRLRSLVRRLEAADATELPDVQAQALKRRLDLLGITIDTYTDRLVEAREHGERWLPAREGDDPFNVATIACAAAISLLGDYRVVDAQENMRVARSSIAQTQSDYGASWVALLSTLPLLYEGDYALAQERLRSALAQARKKLGASAGMVGTLALLAAKTAVERGQDEEARKLLDTGLHRFQTHGVLDTAVFGLDAALKLWTGGAGDFINIAELREHAAAYPPRLSVMFSCLLVRRLVRLGRVDDALAEAGRAGIPLEGPSVRRVFRNMELNATTRELVAATQIDLDIACGRFGRATARIKKQTKSARDGGRSARLVELALDEAAIAICSHSAAVANRHLARAVSLAAKRDYLRVFRDRQELVAGLVNDTRVKDWGFVTDDERRFFGRICAGLPLTNSALREQFDELNVVAALAGTPTARELELLRLIETGLTNQQLADRLSLSVATVKWHLYNLYTKLGVSNRSSALSRARVLNLLAR